MVRLFIGGLAESVTADELTERFLTFGSVKDCVILRPKDDDTYRSPESSCRGFGYLELEPANESALKKCYGVYNGSKWKGRVLRVQPANLHYPAKLDQERQEALEIESNLEKQHQDKHSIKPLTECHEPLIILSPCGEEIKVRSNKRKISFPVEVRTPPSGFTWETLGTPPHLLRRREFVEQMEASFDARASRQEWKAGQRVKVPKEVPESSDELDAVNFVDAGEEVVQQVMDLSRFSDDESDD